MFFYYYYFMLSSYSLLHTFNYIEISFFLVIILLLMDSVPFFTGIHNKSNESILYDASFSCSFVYFSYLLVFSSVCVSFFIGMSESMFIMSFLIWITIYSCKFMFLPGKFLSAIVDPTKEHFLFFITESVLSLFSLLVQPITLYMRVFSNIVFAHVIISLLVFSCPVLFFITMWEAFITVIQTLVYILLLIIYKSKL